MKTAIKITIAIYLVIVVIAPIKNPVDADYLIDMESIPTYPEKVKVDTQKIFVPRDTSKYKGNWVDVN